MKNIEEIATEIVDASFKIHKELGPGLLESAYETCLEYELTNRGFSGGDKPPNQLSMKKSQSTRATGSISQ